LYLADAESESDTNFYWSKTSYKKRTGFIISIFPEMNYLVFRKRSSGDGQIQYGLVQEDVDIYELPFKESKVIGKLKSLSVVPILFGYNYGDSLEDNELIPEKVNNGKKVRSSRIKGIMGGAIGDLAASTDREEVTWQEIDSNVRGYVFANIPFVDSKEKGLEYSKKKILKKRSFLKLKNSKPVIYSDLSLKDKKIYKGQIPKNIFLISDLSVSIEDKKYYKVNLGELSKQIYGKKSSNQFTHWDAFISSEDVEYFSEKDYSDYTLKNTKFKGDKNALLAMKKEFEENGLYLNFTDFELKKIKVLKGKKTYYVAVGYYGYYNKKENRNDFNFEFAILSKSNNSYEIIKRNPSPHAISYKEFLNLTNDDILEVITGGWMMR
jgi:hypothetical protein